jgi:acyl-CoA dehydrogenase
MDQKSFVEGARAFILWGATMIDRAHRGQDKDADGLVSLLTPVIKGFLTDQGYDMTVQAQQVYGGHGYIEEWGMSQFTRDARIAMIYEGANGVQALDLVGRKLAQDGGKHVMAFFDLVKSYAKENAGQDEAFDRDFLEPLKAASKDLQAAGMYFMQNGMKNPNNALAGSTDFMHMFGHVCLGLMWARMAKASMDALKSGTADAAFHETKLATGRYYMARQLPATALHLTRIQTGADTVMALDAANF